LKINDNCQSCFAIAIMIHTLLQSFIFSDELFMRYSYANPICSFKVNNNMLKINGRYISKKKIVECFFHIPRYLDSENNKIFLERSTKKLRPNLFDSSILFQPFVMQIRYNRSFFFMNVVFE